MAKKKRVAYNYYSQTITFTVFGGVIFTPSMGVLGKA